MLYNLFGSNRPVVLAFLVLPAIAVGVLAHNFGTPPSLVPGSPVFDWIHSALLDFPALHIAIGLSLIILNAGVLNSIFNRHDYASKENFLPAFVFFFYSIADLSWVYFNPFQLGVLFLLLSLRRLLTVYRVASPTRMLFDSGFLLGVSVILLPLTVFLIPLLWLGLMQLRSLNFREWLVPLLGLAVPMLYTAVVFWWMDILPELDSFRIHDFRQVGFHLENIDGPQVPFLLLTGGFCLGGGIRFVSDMNVSTVHRKNSKAVFVWLSILLLSAVIYGSGIERVNNGLGLILAAPIAVFSAIFFSGNRRKTLIQFLFYLWWIFSVIHMLFTGVW